MKYIFLLASVFILFTACKDDNTDEKKILNESQLYEAQSDDMEMNATIRMAKYTLGQFDSALLSNKYDTSTFAIKVRFPTSTGSEHIWATSIESRNGNYYGIIDNIPSLTTAVKLNEKVLLNKGDISDWMYSDNGKLRGGYTIKLIRRRMGKEEQDKFDKDFPFKLED